MEELRPLRIAVAAERPEELRAIAALLPNSDESRFQLDTFVGGASAGQAVALARHDAYLIHDALLSDHGPDDPAACPLLARAVETGRPVIILTSGEAQDAARFVDAGAWDCVARAAVTPSQLAHCLDRGLRHARRRAAERRQLQARKMEAMARFAGGIAHDFNNLLTAMLGYAEMLRESLDPSDIRREDVLEIQRAGERATALTKQLLTFGLRQRAQPRVLDLNALVQRVSAILPPLLGDRVDVRLQLAQGLDPVRADATQLEVMIANLARNAGDAMPSGGGLRLETSLVQLDEAEADRVGARPGRYALLTVADTGAGMTPDVMSHLFEPFFTTKEKGKGTGLGLPVAYGIVRQAGGQIVVDSRPGEGTTVKCYFPATEEEERPRA